MATAVLLSSLFSDIEGWEWHLYVRTLLAVWSTPFIGLLLTKAPKEDSPQVKKKQLSKAENDTGAIVMAVRLIVIACVGGLCFYIYNRNELKNQEHEQDWVAVRAGESAVFTHHIFHSTRRKLTLSAHIY